MRQDLERLYDFPFNFVVDEMDKGKAVPSFTSKFLNEKDQQTEEDKEFVKAAAASLYSGGADTVIKIMLRLRCITTPGSPDSVLNIILHSRNDTLS